MIYLYHVIKKQHVMTTSKKNAADFKNDRVDTNQIKGGKTYVSNEDTEQKRKPQFIGEETFSETAKISPDSVKAVESDKPIGIHRTRK